MWKRLCGLVGAPDLAEDERFSSPGRRSRNRDALNPILEEKLQHKTAAEWIKAFNDAGIPCGPILSVDQVFANEQVEHLGLAQPVEHPALGTIRILGSPVTLSRTPARLHTATAEKGAHTDAVLHELGMADDEIERLRQDGVI